MNHNNRTYFGWYNFKENEEVLRTSVSTMPGLEAYFFLGSIKGTFAMGRKLLNLKVYGVPLSGTKGWMGVKSLVVWKTVPKR